MKNSLLVINIIYNSNLFILFNELNTKSDQKKWSLMSFLNGFYHIKSKVKR